MNGEFNKVYVSECSFNEAVDYLHNALHSIELEWLLSILFNYILDCVYYIYWNEHECRHGSDKRTWSYWVGEEKDRNRVGK